MAVQYAVRIVCDGCGLEAEWREGAHDGSDGGAVSDARDALKRARWMVRLSRGDKDLCPHCIRCEKQDGRLVLESADGPATPPSRDQLGRVVREAWVRWAKMQPDPKPHWLSPYDDLGEPDKEADRQIGEAVAAFITNPEAPRGR